MTRHARTIRSTYVLAIAFALAALLAACGGGGSSGSSSSNPASAPARGFGASSSVDIKGFAYNPDSITVAKGGSVTWTNSDSKPHTATTQGTFDTGTLTQGQSKQITFDKPGTYDYICTLHPFMKGKVVVTP
jgi:plastocyanin